MSCAQRREPKGEDTHGQVTPFEDKPDTKIAPRGRVAGHQSTRVWLPGGVTDMKQTIIYPLVQMIY